MLKYLILSTIKNEKTALLKILALIIVICIYTLIMYLNFTKKENWNNIHNNNEKDMSLSEIIYFNITSLTTVGYGDIVPKNGNIRIVILSMVLIGYIITIV